MTTGELIRDARKKKGLTQKELGERLGISDVSIAQWENGLRNPRLETRQKLAKALDMDVTALMSDNEKQDYFSMFGSDSERVDLALMELKKQIEAKANNLREYGGIATPARRRSWALELARDLAEKYHVPERSILKKIGLDDLPTETEIDLQLQDDDLVVDENQIADDIIRLIMSMNSSGCKAALRHIQELSKIPDYKREDYYGAGDQEN